MSGPFFLLLFDMFYPLIEDIVDVVIGEGIVDILAVPSRSDEIVLL